MGRSALSYLLTFQRASRPLPTTPELSDWIEALALDRGRPWITSGATGSSKHRITWERLPEMATSAAEYALENYDPHFLAKAVRGGENSSREKHVTLDMFREVAHLDNVAKEMAALQCSKRTVMRRRAEFMILAAAVPVITGDPIMDALLAGVSVDVESHSPATAPEGLVIPWEVDLSGVDFEAVVRNHFQARFPTFEEVQARELIGS